MMLVFNIRQSDVTLGLIRSSIVSPRSGNFGPLLPPSLLGNDSVTGQIHPNRVELNPIKPIAGSIGFDEQLWRPSSTCEGIRSATVFDPLYSSAVDSLPVSARLLAIWTHRNADLVAG